MDRAHAPLIIDVAGLALTAADRSRLADPLVGGIILFTRNWADRAQLSALCAEVKALRADLLILVDHEGGRVQRFRTDGFTRLPAMRHLGELWSGGVPRIGLPPASLNARWGIGASDESDVALHALHAMRVASACGFVLGAELRACGVDMSFTPVLDLDHGTSGVIGDRSFARGSAVVSVLARSLAQGLLKSGMRCCGKHFPGHGFAQADSHIEMAVDTRELEVLLADDASPYQHLCEVLDAVMPAHVIYPRVDGRPAGFSRVWLQDMLRERLGFLGAVFSDDLSMAAARRIDGHAVSPAEAVIAAIEAGCDLVLLCNQSLEGGTVLDEALEALRTALARGDWALRSASETRRRSLLPCTAALDWDALMTDPAYRRARSLLP